MADDETPPEFKLQLPKRMRAYFELYPKLHGRLKTISESGDPAIRAKVGALAAMMMRRQDGADGRLLDRYGLTPTEVRLATHIAAGGSVADYAALHKVSEGTVRTHLKAVFAKTGVHRQADLVRLLAGGG
jgi:DNA-binding CsgD family transcriptional regulator